MSTTWTRAANSICRNGLSLCGVAESGQAIGADDMQLALDSLDAVLKELPLYGYTWPQLSAETALTWTGQTFTLPSDFYGYPIVWSDGRRLPELNTADWNALADKSPDGSTVSHFYISPANVLYVYPNPASDPLLTLQYQRIVDDTVFASGVDMPQFWINTLGYGVANELTLHFGVSPEIAMRIEKRWEMKRERALKNSVSSAPISFGVADDRVPDPNNWQAGDPIPGGYDANLAP